MKALHFNGAGGCAIAENFEWQYGGPVTVEFWIKVNNDEVRNGSVFSVGGQNNPNRFQVHVPWGDKKLYWDYGNCGGPGRVYVNYENYLNKWTHVALVSDGIQGQPMKTFLNANKISDHNGGKFMGVYLNGELVVSKQSSQGPSVPLKGLKIGKWQETNCLGKGAVSDFRIWDRVRTEAEIKANMHQRQTGNESGLLGYWKLDEGTGAECADSSNLGNPATIHGATWVDATNLNLQ